MPGKSISDPTMEIIALKLALETRTSELHAAQKQLEKDAGLAALGQLVSTVVHELRSPLGAMLTSLHLVENRVGDADPAVTKGIDRIRRSVRRCDDTITRLLDFSRHETLEPEPTRIDQWLRAMFHNQALPEGVSLTFEPGLGDRRVTVDRDRLRRAVVHLIENAIQSIADGGKPGHIAVDTRPADGHVEIRITDNGPGIPDDHRANIFEPFFSARRSGIGLGLPIARRIAKQHGGTLSLTSRPGQETSFAISLPLDAESAEGG
ncbi:MAG: HAMP domain-containing histidine kinase [Proteobacteria bacterium]|nr:HAMP domain-containing histidine kinase [Pseudomonadota bacterium]MCK4867094.1 HAMP domain-containing histidine kinase [Alphaproteobacteria bacterium]